ncbi:hypothetical protein XOC_4284 [Xanthomonas oryzae pv. oryzicola BLS256]|uniref:Uncharacterized protein n=1 Tax=Xanthomonas oryzae pv. oryzicola (strain BLS256) TaxID=383407 RepID=G7TLA9_XANOB|nr:hypothetical protein XOC_4284 [Xanthomonas oryzae pv. oryzicola BLS256]QEO95434.1 hypothetical protein XOCgx_0439 [Xanthomonas oryzae pv. oryzicola]
MRWCGRKRICRGGGIRGVDGKRHARPGSRLACCQRCAIIGPMRQQRAQNLWARCQ